MLSKLLDLAALKFDVIGPYPKELEKGVITKGVFSLEEPLESLKTLTLLNSLAFFDFLAFFVFRFPSAFLLSFPRILGLPRTEKPLLFPGFPFLFFQKSKGQGRSQNSLESLENWPIPPVRLGHSGRNSGRIPDLLPETLSERFLEFPLRVRLGSPKPYNSRHMRFPEHFQNSLPPSAAGDASFFRSGSGEGLSEPVMEFQQYWGYF